MQRGQTTVELLMLLTVSMVALMVIYSLYSEQVLSSQISNDSFKAKATVQKIVDAANTVYLSGKDSELKIFIEIPGSADLTNSGFSGRSVSIRLSNESDIVGIADVNMIGSFKANTGKYILYLSYDGNVVNIGYRDFEFNKQSIFASITQGDNLSQTFTIRNNSSSQMRFFVDNNFSHSLVTLNIDASDTYFTLNNGELQTVDFNFETDVTAYGNYAGAISVTGEQNDINTTKLMYVSVESYLQISDLMIYPRTTIISGAENDAPTQDYSMCNHSSSNITGITWNSAGAAASFIDANPSVTSVNALDCENFTLNFTLGASSSDANLTATYDDGNTYTTFMTFNSS